MYLQITLLVCAIVNFRYAQLINDFGNTKEGIYACVGRILHAQNISDLTVVNLKDNDALAKIVYGDTLPRLVLNRNYLSSHLLVYNKAYVIYSTKYEELIAGMTNLTKDIYWNPRASIVIAIKEISENAIKEAFQHLHFLNAFHSSIVTQRNDDETYVYQSKDSNNELTKVHCKDKKSINELKLVKYLKDPFENMTLIVNDVAPYTFIQNNSENKLIGYDEIFMNIATEFSNITIVPTFNIKNRSGGLVFDNFTVVGSLRRVQMGEVDGILGAMILTENRLKMFDFIHTHFSDNLVFVVPKSKKLGKWQAMFLTFKTTLSSVFTQPLDAHQVDSVDEIVEQNFQMYINKQTYPLLNITRAFQIYGIFQNTILTDSPRKSLQIVAEGGKKVALISRSWLRLHFTPYKPDRQQKCKTVFHFSPSSRQNGRVSSEDVASYQCIVGWIAFRVAIEGLNEKAISNSGPSSRIYEQRKKEKEDRRHAPLPVVLPPVVGTRDTHIPLLSSSYLTAPTTIHPWVNHRETNTWSAGTDATYSNGGSTESASRETSHPRDVTNDDQSTRAHDDPSNKADTHNATRRLQELELREIRAAKALAKTDRALGQLYDDEECLDTCHETVEIPTDRSRTTFESQTADETAGDKGTRTNEHVRAPSRETENLTRALTDALSFLRSDQKPAPPKYLHELPNFYGEINEWIAFRTVYRDTQCHFTESQNVARLRKALKGDARKT
ncbi:hypothetical protein EVAR_44518_1 [Eumeta japonica]|uniref:Uncharacterized protein n=1 Tax=Eumeta variegata TaxID=151549 RepID=A0A4C1YHI0_EUMVA|nr:hypothetical protein EVAR_44518_1 [Eumeta japonica]